MAIVYATTITPFLLTGKKPNTVQNVAAEYLRKMNPKVSKNR